MSDRFTNKTYVGSGAMATVYRAWDSVMQRDVALKEIASELQDNTDVRDLLLNEARKIAKIKHPNVVQIYDVTYDDNIPTIVQEYVGGGSLASAIGSGTASVDVTLGVLEDVFSGLDAIHSSGLIHRDIKPDNLLNGDGTWKLVDFGVAMQGDEDVIPFVGSKYAAPEILLAPNTISEKCDFYSTGVMAMELLLGAAAFERVAREVTAKSTGSQGPESPNAFWQKWSYSKLAWPRLDEIDSKFSAPLSEFIARLVAQNPDERPADAGEILGVLADLREAERQILSAPTLPIGGAAVKTEEGDEKPAKRKQPLWFKAVAVVLVLALGGIGALLLMPKKGPPPLLINNSTEASQYVSSALADVLPGMAASIVGAESQSGITTMKIGSEVVFELSVDQPGELALIHLSADNILSFIYPAPGGAAPTLVPGELNTIASDLRLEVSEPAGTEYWILLNLTAAFDMPDNIPLIPVDDWAQAYEIQPDPAFSGRLMRWLSQRALVGWTVLEVNVIPSASVTSPEGNEES